MPRNILLLCGRVVPMTGQRLDGPQVIEIANDRIVGISAADDSARSLPDIRDLSRFTVLPGLVDSHTHLDFDVLAGLETQQASVDARNSRCVWSIAASSTFKWASRRSDSSAAAISSI